ncbi:MAG: hypothetical protein KBC33_01375 [Candidatus Pacebacteria bacterium]|nr:hypothetical protein [Candidatus Paceibacterota bacterium]
MNTLTLQKQSNKLEKIIKTASRALFEFEVAQAKWERAHGMGRSYKSVDAFMRHIKRKLK